MTQTNDQRIQRDVLAELRDEPSVDAAQIGIIVQDGVVTLTGHVPTHGEKGVAEGAAKRVSGVRAVADELDVKLRADHVRTDEDIAVAAANALKWNTFVPRDAVQATVEKGWTTLDGVVDWMYQKDAGQAAVRHLMGVKSVINLIKLRSRAHVKPAELKNLIHDALKRNAELEARRIGIDVHGDKVKLHGDVHSWSEVRAARRAAWSAPGVLTVDCQLHIVP